MVFSFNEEGERPSPVGNDVPRWDFSPAIGDRKGRMTRLAARKKTKGPRSLRTVGLFYGATRDLAAHSTPHTARPEGLGYALTLSDEAERRTKPLSRLGRIRFRSLQGG